MGLFGGSKELGKVIHYFDKIGVIVVALTGKVKVGDTIKVSRGEGEFEETIRSMQIDHEEVQKASKGAEVAIKVSQPTKPGALVSKA